MPIQIKEEKHGKLLVIHVSGNLIKADYEAFVPKFDSLVRKEGRLRLLIDMTGFQAAAGAWWEEVKFDIKHFSDIERLAVVGDKKWEKVMVASCKPFTLAEVRYFDVSGEDEARQWVYENMTGDTW